MSGPLTDIYQHDALYELYPELLDAQYEVVPEERLPGKLAGYSPKYGTIYITTDPDVTPSVIAHEVQHAIQDVDERFDFGLSEEASQEVYSQVEQELKGKLPLERARALAARIQYLSQAHEIQAFDTQNRFELTADERAKYEPNNPSTYYQNIRGQIEPTANGKWLISVFKGKKNLSTVIHETGHFFLENLRDAAALETAPDWVKNDWAAIKGELGIKDDGFIEREAHEKFARQFEAYAREGKAPRPELQSAFNQFRAWLTAIYRSVRRLLGDAELSADVRAVFDRLLASEEDIAWILHSVNNPHNGLTFCAGSLSAGLHNNVPALARMFAHRTHFVHLRSTNAFPNGNFIEASHLGGRAHIIELIRIFEKERPGVPMRVDHGRMMLGDTDKGYNPGYSFHGRMMALAQIEGMMAVVNDESKLES